MLWIGCDPNIAAKDGSRPLHVCLSADLVHLLVNAGAELEAADSEGTTPLIAAAKNGNATAVEVRF